MKHIKQGKNNCGQTCLAMISEQTIEYVAKFLNKKGGTRAADYIKYLEAHDCEVVNKRFKRCNWDTKLPKLCIIKCHNIPKTSYTHVILYCGGVFFDPEMDGGYLREVYQPHIDKYLRPTSYMEIKPNNPCNLYLHPVR